MIYVSRQIPNHICCNLSNKFMMLLFKNLELAAEKHFSKLLSVRIFALIVGFKSIKPYQSEVAAIHKTSSLTTRIELLRFIGSMVFYSKNIDKFHNELKRL